jgi:cytochrome c-type biogenesis protein CcmF
VDVARDGEPVRTLHPEKRIYDASGQTMTEAAIATRIRGDLYVSLGEPVSDSGAWGVRVYIKPFVDWIWAGAFIMALGGFIAIGDRRYRVAVKSRVGAWAAKVAA